MRTGNKLFGNILNEEDYSMSLVVIYALTFETVFLTVSELLGVRMIFNHRLRKLAKFEEHQTLVVL